MTDVLLDTAEEAQKAQQNLAALYRSGEIVLPSDPAWFKA